MGLFKPVVFFKQKVEAAAPAVDPDAQAFLTATGITDATIDSAVNQLCLDLKSAGIYSKMIAIYPMVGGTANTHKYNLVNPQDTDAAFRLTYGSNVTHSSEGLKPGGSNNQSAFTRINIKNNLSRNDVYCGVYIGTNVIEDRLDFGAISSGNGIQCGTRVNSGNFSTKLYDNTNDLIAVTDARGFSQMTRNSSSGYTMQKDTTRATNSTTSISPPNEWIALGGIGTNITSTAAVSTKFISYAAFGSGLTNTELDDYYTAVQAFQTTLGRNF